MFAQFDAFVVQIWLAEGRILYAVYLHVQSIYWLFREGDVIVNARGSTCWQTVDLQDNSCGDWLIYDQLIKLL